MADRDPKWSDGESRLLYSPTTNIDTAWSDGQSFIFDEYVAAGGTTYYQSITGDAPAAAAALSRLTGKALSGDTPAQSGSLSRAVAFVRSLSGDMPAASASLVASVVFLRSIAGELPAAAGAIAKQIGKGLSGTFENLSATLSRLISVNRSGDNPAPSGTPGPSYMTSQAAAGDMPAPSGLISSILNPVVTLVRRIGDWFWEFFG